MIASATTPIWLRWSSFLHCLCNSDGEWYACHPTSVTPRIFRIKLTARGPRHTERIVWNGNRLLPGVSYEYVPYRYTTILSSMIEVSFTIACSHARKYVPLQTHLWHTLYYTRYGYREKFKWYSWFWSLYKLSVIYRKSLAWGVWPTNPRTCRSFLQGTAKNYTLDHNCEAGKH